MNKHPLFSLTLIAMAALAGCSTMPASNPMLDQAHNDFRAAQGNPQTLALAGPEMKQAGDALTRADDAWTRRDSSATIDHLAYLAQQRIVIAQQTGAQKAAEQTVTNAGLSRDKLRLEARTDEADSAERRADFARRQALDSQRMAVASQLQADVSQQQASDAQARNSQLQAQLQDMNAKKTDRGMVVTIGDVLFDTDKAQLKSGGMRSVEKLAGFFKQYPQRRALVEGFTDSTGSESHNEELSGRRADAVRTALVGMGVGGDRIATHGYGEAYPVASNDNSGGRQMNRRVEIVLSDDNGNIVAR